MFQIWKWPSSCQGTIALWNQAIQLTEFQKPILWLDIPHSTPISVYWSSVPCQWYTDQTSLPNHPHQCFLNIQKVWGHGLCLWMENKRRDSGGNSESMGSGAWIYTNPVKMRLWFLAGQERLRKVKKCLGFSTSTHPVRMSMQRTMHNSVVGCLPPPLAHEPQGLIS